jgi:SWI/SNF-related matrix-associated actin-dependent regulator 1 of chromatin subfamily A
MTDARPYQIEGAEFLAARRQAYCADEMGLGKSYQLIMACDKVEAKRILVVCPATVRSTLANEFRRRQQVDRQILVITEGRGYPSLNGPIVVIISYDLAVDPHWQTHLKVQWDVIGFDEAHYLKSPDAQRTQKLIGKDGLAHRADRHWFLSGTIMPNHIGEIWPVLRVFFSAALLLPNNKFLSYEGFLERYCILVNSEFGVKVVGHKDLTPLRARLKDFVIRRKKRDVAKDLPPISFYDVPIELPAPEVAEAEKDGTIGAEVMQWVNDAGSPISLSTLSRLHGTAKVPAIVEMVKDSLASGVEKIVVFAWHRDVIEGIYKGLVDSVSVVGITGETSAGARDRAIERFQNDPVTQVFLGQIKAAGTGITLTAAHHVIFAEMSWCPADNAQAAMRVHRIGQTMPVTVRFAKLAGSLDEAIISTLRRKTALLNDFFTDLEKDQTT